jgi:hypothetical protein
MKTDTEKVVQAISDYVNSYSGKSKEFNLQMSRDHRTIQQSFTKLCFQWLEYVASDDYQTDGRNEQSKETAKLMIELMRQHYKNSGYSDSTLDLMATPSKHLNMI